MALAHDIVPTSALRERFGLADKQFACHVRPSSLVWVGVAAAVGGAAFFVQLPTSRLVPDGHTEPYRATQSRTAADSGGQRHTGRRCAAEQHGATQSHTDPPAEPHPPAHVGLAAGYSSRFHAPRPLFSRCACPVPLHSAHPCARLQVYKVLQESEFRVKELRNRFMVELRDAAAILTEDIGQLQHEVDLFSIFSDESKTDEYYQKVRRLEDKIREYKERIQLYNSRENLFSMPRYGCWLQSLANTTDQPPPPQSV